MTRAMSGFRVLLAATAFAAAAFATATPATAHAQGQTAGIPADARYTAADVAFMQGMIGHHAQALEMSVLVAGRSSRPELALLAERITVSQRDEIAIMQTWLRERRQPVPAIPASDTSSHTMSHASSHDMHAGHDMHVMPGMLSPAQMDSLKQARGTAFDRLFLQYMIQHHEGALTMVAALLKTPAAAREPMVFQFVSDVDTDQRAEIRRMKALLDKMPATAP